jgi:hypothetical protein
MGNFNSSNNVAAISSTTGLGSNVATFLATPTSTNLAAALTTKTGTVNCVFSASPTLTGTVTVSNGTLFFGGTSGSISVGGAATLSISRFTLAGNADFNTRVITDGKFKGTTFQDTSDATKLLTLGLGSISTGTTRTLTAPDADGTLALIDVEQTFSQAQTFDAGIFCNAINGLAITDYDPDGFALAGGSKSLYVANSMSFYATDDISVDFGGGGTVVYEDGVLGDASANSLTFSSTSGIIGTTTNDNAAAGSVGEIIESNVDSGSAISLTTATAANVTSISLTPGDWDVWGTVAFASGGSTSLSSIIGSINEVSATQATAPNGGAYVQLAGGLVGVGNTQVTPVGSRRITVASPDPVTIYLVATGNFTVSTLSAYGYLGARRRR